MGKRWESLKQKLKPGRGNQAAQALEAEAAPDPAINEDATAALTAQLLRFNSTFSAYTSLIINTSKMSQNHLSKMMGAQEALGDTIEKLRWRERTKSPQNLEIRYNLCLSILEQMEELAIGAGEYSREQDQTGIEARLTRLQNWLPQKPMAAPAPSPASAPKPTTQSVEEQDVTSSFSDFSFSPSSSKIQAIVAAGKQDLLNSGVKGTKSSLSMSA